MSMRRVGVLLLAFTALAVSACSTVLAPDFGVREGRLAPCPPRRDCVSTQDQDPQRYIAPLTYTSTRDQARTDLIAAVNSAGPGNIVSSHRNYLRVAYPTSDRTDRASEYYYQPANAVDEVEFYLVPGTHMIEMRSIARLGLLDIGANRARLERLRAVFNALQQQRG